MCIYLNFIERVLWSRVEKEVCTQVYFSTNKDYTVEPRYKEVGYNKTLL